jgi:hypothetical protein
MKAGKKRTTEDAQLSSELFGGCLPRSEYIRHREGRSV